MQNNQTFNIKNDFSSISNRVDIESSLKHIKEPLDKASFNKVGPCWVSRCKPNKNQICDSYSVENPLLLERDITP